MATFSRSITPKFNLKFLIASLRELESRDPLLTRLGWLFWSCHVFFVLLMVFDPHIITGANAWVKPMKFTASFGLYCWTLAWFFEYLKPLSTMMQVMRWLIAATAVVEIGGISLQAWRGVMSHHNYETPFDHAVFWTIIAMILVSTALVGWMGVLFFHRSYGLPSGYLWSIRLSFLIFLIGCAIGGDMLGHGRHTVGASENAPGPPFLNWSTTGGDLRPSHFLALHAIQFLPFASWLLLIWKPEWSESLHRLWAWTMSIAYSIFIIAAYVEAEMGVSLLWM